MELACTRSRAARTVPPDEASTEIPPLRPPLGIAFPTYIGQEVFPFLFASAMGLYGGKDPE
jgi:hypothetical protein